MKNVNTKALMLLTIFITSAFAMPSMAVAYDTNDLRTSQFDDLDPGSLIQMFPQMFGSLLSSNLGYGGAILGQIFLMMFQQGFENFSQTELLPGVFVLTANNETTISGSNTYSSEKTRYYLPYGYDVTGVDGTVYVDVTKSGSYTYTMTLGAGATLVIWDNDRSFVSALIRVINFLKKMLNTDFNSLTNEQENALISEGVALITWFLIHINDIFNGDEYFALNPITWQKIEIDPNYTITAEWKQTGSDYQIDGDDTAVPGSELYKWNQTATNEYDEHTLWLLELNTTKIFDTPLSWTQFSFDIMQLWMKNFEIHINVGNILDGMSGGGEPNFGDIFGGCDIEFYFFTHHLTGAFLYNDKDGNDELSVEYDPLINGSTGQPMVIDNKTVEVPNGSELTHRLLLNGVKEFDFEEPTLSGDGQQLSWGLRMNEVGITPVPIGLDLDSYPNKTQEKLDDIFFGLTFDPELGQIIAASDGTTYQVASAPIKLDQGFAPWNDNVNPNTNTALSPNSDLAILYTSTVLHFHLNIATQTEDPTDPSTLLDPSQDYQKGSKTLSIGNYLDPNVASRIEFVDIASEEYFYGNQSEIDNEVNLGTATTAEIPLALWTGEMERHDTFNSGSGGSVETFATDLRITAEFQVMAYAVCYPAFNGSGTGILHDPTFNVFMIFEPTIFWAVILLVGGITLVGVATILIKRKKDGKKPF